MTAASDAHDLHKAIKGLGTDDSALVGIVGHRTKEELVSIAYTYEQKYHKTLSNDIKGDTSGNYRKLAVALTKPFPAYLARALHKAVAGLGTDDSALIDLLAFSLGKELVEAGKAYKLLYKKDLIDDVKGDTSGNYRTALSSLLSGSRQEHEPMDAEVVEKAAQDFYKKGEGRLGTSDEYFIHFLTSHSPHFIHAVDQAYRHKNGHSLRKAIKKETSGDYKNLLVALASHRSHYFAKRINQAIKGLGTDDRKLKRAFVLNDKREMKHIAERYAEKYKKSLSDDIKGDTSGWYQKLLLARIDAH